MSSQILPRAARSTSRPVGAQSSGRTAAAAASSTSRGTAQITQSSSRQRLPRSGSTQGDRADQSRERLRRAGTGRGIGTAAHRDRSSGPGRADQREVGENVTSRLNVPQKIRENAARGRLNGGRNPVSTGISRNHGIRRTVNDNRASVVGVGRLGDQKHEDNSLPAESGTHREHAHDTAEPRNGSNREDLVQSEPAERVPDRDEVAERALPREQEEERALPGEQGERALPEEQGERALPEEQALPRVQEEEGALPRAQEGEERGLPREQEEGALRGEREEQPLPREEEQALPRAHEDEEVLPGAHEDEEVLPGAHEDEEVLPGAHEDEEVLPGAHEDEEVLPGAHEDEQVLPREQEEEAAALPGEPEAPSRPPEEEDRGWAAGGMAGWPEEYRSETCTFVKSFSGRYFQDWVWRPSPWQTMEGGDGEASQPAAAVQTESRTLKDENNFIQNVSQFFNQEDISDVVLKVGEKKFFGHKFVLAKSSEVFRTMLYDKRWQQAGLPEIDLEESEECQLHFEPFLRFLYTAEVQICVNSAVGILCLADKYSVMSLKTLCTRYMVDNTQSPKVQNALNWYSWAKALHMEDLIDSCTKTISWNMEQLFTLNEWLEMDIDFVADILGNPQLVVSNEFTLYQAVERWLLSDSHLTDLDENSKKLLPLVRFPQMMVQQVYKVETGELAQKDGSKDLIEKLLNKAYRFRSLCPFQADLNITFSEEFYRPRNYKDLTVDTVRMQNTLRFGIQVDVRTYVGPVPSTVREGEWKITYRKSNDSWTLQVYCHDSAMVNGEARIQVVLVISDDDDRVLQVEASEETVCSRGNHLTMVITLPSNNEAKLMTVLIKPLPN